MMVDNTSDDAMIFAIGVHSILDHEPDSLRAQTDDADGEMEYILISFAEYMEGENCKMKLNKLGLFGIISLLSYTAMVVFSPLAYPGYDWMSMAVSDLSAEGAPSLELAKRLNALFGPCGIVSIMAVCVATSGYKSKLFKAGIYAFVAMEWICNVGYKIFPWVAGAPNSNPQNVCHLIVTAMVVVFSLASLILIAISARYEGLKSLGIWAIVCLLAMLLGPFGTAFMPKSVFGIFERFSTFSAVIFNAVLGWYLFTGRFFDNNNDKSVYY